MHLVMSCRIGLPGLGRAGLGFGRSILRKKACKSGIVGLRTSLQISSFSVYDNGCSHCRAALWLALRVVASAANSGRRPRQKSETAISLCDLTLAYLLGLQILDRDLCSHGDICLLCDALCSLPIHILA